MVVITDSTALYDLFERAYTKAVEAGYTPPAGYDPSKIVTGLKEAVAYRIPNSKCPENLKGREQDGHIVLEGMVKGAWLELSRTRIPQPK